jgi:hypothetical protein
MSSGTVTEFGPVLPPLDFSGNEMRENENGGASATFGEEDLWLANLKRPLEGQMRKWKNNIRININPLKTKRILG